MSGIIGKHINMKTIITQTKPENWKPTPFKGAMWTISFEYVFDTEKTWTRVSTHKKDIHFYINRIPPRGKSDEQIWAWLWTYYPELARKCMNSITINAIKEVQDSFENKIKRIFGFRS